MSHAVMFNRHRKSALLQGSGEEFCADNRPWDGATIDDPLKRLTAILNRNSAGAIITKYEYTYNTLDLKDTETITGASPLDNLTDGTTTYTPNDVNQIVSIQNPNRTYTYDNDGNMTTGFTPEGYTLALSYDAASRLIKAEYTDSGNTVHKTEYTYDGDDLLAIMKKTIGTSITETRYIRAGFLPIQERDAANAITREYLWGQNMGGGIGGLLNLRQSGADYNYLYDGKGNVTSLIDAAQATVAQYAYDPFGRVMKKTGTLDQPFQFSTKQYDAETGKSYFGFRWYDANTGRWLTRDPLGEESDPNLYRAVGNNPMNWIDPDGQAIAAPVLIGGALIGAAIISQSPPVQQALRDVGNAIINAASSINDSITDAVKRQKEYEQAKQLSDTPPPSGGSDCANLSRQIDHAERVIRLYENWDASWSPGRHSQKIQDWRQRLQNLKDEYNRRCVNKCR